MRLAVATFLGFSLLSAAAFAQPPAPPATPPAETPAATPPAEDKQLICVGQDPAASTRVHARRICRTLEEWNKRGGVPK